MAIPAVSIPSSSGHQFTAYRPVVRDRATGADVSIPSSSGHQFTVANVAGGGTSCGRVSIPSSSGHQFTATFMTASIEAGHNQVSIPSSSGHQFTD